MIGLDGFTLKPACTASPAGKIRGLHFPTHKHTTSGKSRIRGGSAASTDPTLVGNTGEWEYSKRAQTSSGPYHIFSHIHKRISLGVWEDAGIMFVQANVSRLQNGAAHNGRIVTDAHALWDSIETVKRELQPLLLHPEGLDLEVKALEIGGVVRQPFTTFWSLLSSLNYPGLRKAPIMNPGESMKWGTSSSSKFMLRIYDKGRQLNSGHGCHVPLPENTFTRIEIVLRGETLWDAFGGRLLPLLTSETMREQFFTRLYKMQSEPRTNLQDFPTTKAGTLAIALHYAYQNGSCPEVQDWWLEANGRSQNSRKVLKDALAIFQQSSSISLRDLVPEDAPVLHLPESAEREGG